MKSQADRTDDHVHAEHCEGCGHPICNACGAAFCDACGVRIVPGGEMR